MENIEVSKEKSQSALYFKPRFSIGKFTTPIDESNPAGVWRDWTFGDDSGRTYELQLSALSGELIDCRIHTQEFEKDGRTTKETSLLICLEDNSQSKVLKLPVKNKHGLSREFQYFAMRCAALDPQYGCVFEFWSPPNADNPVLLYKQKDGGKYPTTRKSNYVWNKEEKKFDGLPALVESTDFSGEKTYDSKERDTFLYGLVEEFCKKIQDTQDANAESEPTPAPETEELPDF